MTAAASNARAPADVVLIVDDVPDNVSVLHDALDDAGYTVLVALDGASALKRAAQAQPDVVLLDAVMPGMDGFEVARRLKADAETAHIPIVFMTGLTETEHVLAAFAAGGIDYVTKPIRPAEVLVRMAAHLHSARQARQARSALDAYGQATLAVRFDPVDDDAARIVWQTPLARSLLQAYFVDAETPAAREAVPPALIDWLQTQVVATSAPGTPPQSLTVAGVGDQRLVLSLQQHTADGDWLIVMRVVSDAVALEALTRTFRLTLREAEVLYWVTKGKTNRDIGDILGSSPATVKKHLEHVYAKLGVETRTAAASAALGALGAASGRRAPDTV